MGSDFDCSIARLRRWWVLFAKKIQIHHRFWAENLGRHIRSEYATGVCNHVGVSPAFSQPLTSILFHDFEFWKFTYKAWLIIGRKILISLSKSTNQISWIMSFNNFSFTLKYQEERFQSILQQFTVSPSNYQMIDSRDLKRSSPCRRFCCLKLFLNRTNFIFSTNTTICGKFLRFNQSFQLYWDFH